jgi:hypothetical protein
VKQLKTNKMTTFTENNATYTTREILVRGNVFAVTIVTGRFNYVSVRKVTNNPFGPIGKDFANFDEAIKNYKSAEMKTELLKIELGLY